MPQSGDETGYAQLNITQQEARHVASLLRYAVSLNTTAGLVFPTQRRLATSTYRAVELAASILEGKPFEEAVEESNRSWTGSLEEDHKHALEILQRERDVLIQAMTSRLTPEQIADYIEVAQDQFVELIRPYVPKREDQNRPEG